LQNSNPDDDGLERNAVSLGARYHLSLHWDGLLEYRWLDVEEADDLTNLD
jgi:hypothetical protein